MAKTSAQLNREIAEALRTALGTRKPHATRTKKPARGKAPLRVAYRLQLTPGELSAVEMARGRYAWADMLAEHATEGGLVAFTEWCDDVDSDAEGGHSPFPMASGALSDKLQSFYDQRV
jgi:hypothetical protein